MRVLNRDAFLALPAGIIYATGTRWSFSGLRAKGDTCGDDWYEFDPCWIEADVPDDAFERLESMLAIGTSYPMETAECRDGMFESDAVFLVFERDDLKLLRAKIETAITLARTLNV